MSLQPSDFEKQEYCKKKLKKNILSRKNMYKHSMYWLFDSRYDFDQESRKYIDFGNLKDNSLNNYKHLLTVIYDILEESICTLIKKIFHYNTTSCTGSMHTVKLID